MDSERSVKINGNLIEEFYWAGEIVTYVNNKLEKGTFEEVCKRYGQS